jgi:hypothetical protein
MCVEASHCRRRQLHLARLLGLGSLEHQSVVGLAK